MLHRAASPLCRVAAAHWRSFFIPVPRRASSHASAAPSSANQAPLSPPQPNRDKIILKGLVFFGYHGVHSAERQLGQRFVVDAELTVDLALAGAASH